MTRSASAYVMIFLLLDNLRPPLFDETTAALLEPEVTSGLYKPREHKSHFVMLVVIACLPAAHSSHSEFSMLSAA
jgi:hypothetical protein